MPPLEDQAEPVVPDVPVAGEQVTPPVQEEELAVRVPDEPANAPTPPSYGPVRRRVTGKTRDDLYQPAPVPEATGEGSSSSTAPGPREKRATSEPPPRPGERLKEDWQSAE
eukprot:8842095-Lingulodinium_polyedra.AAC.1